MKETYVKPSIFFESFSLTQTIARNCGDTHTGTFGPGSNHYNENTCEWDVGGLMLFFTSDPSGRCEDGPDEAGDEYELEGICYNNPDGGQEIFSST